MDKDLQSIQEARDLLTKAKLAQEELNLFSQKQVDAICAAIAEEGFRQSEYLARLAVEETRLGRVESKRVKNEFCTRDLWAAMENMKTCGIIERDEKKSVYQIAEPMGTVAAIIPTTNPTSTTIYKILIALKARNSIVISPHPRAIQCINESARICNEAALKAGLPAGAIGCMKTVTLEGTTELMRHKYTSVIVSTGGEGIVRAAYSSGKPAFGVGPGNAPVYIEKSADIRHAVSNIVESKLFDYGTVCATEQSVIVDQAISDQVKEEFRKQKAYFVSDEERRMMEPVCVKKGLMNPDVVGQSAHKIAELCGFAVPEETSLLIAELSSVGRHEPLSNEILAPILTYYSEPDWMKACERCLEVLRFGGMGHTMVIHSRSQEVIMEFALKKPAYRFCVNTPATFGAIGYSTGLFPAMSLSCGTSGGNISADNISPLNLVNIKRLALDIRDDAFTPTMRVSEDLVSDFVPFQERQSGAPAKATSDPQPKADADVSVVYNGRRRDLGSL